MRIDIDAPGAMLHGGDGGMVTFDLHRISLNPDSRLILGPTGEGLGVCVETANDELCSSRLFFENLADAIRWSTAVAEQLEGIAAAERKPMALLPSEEVK